MLSRQGFKRVSQPCPMVKGPRRQSMDEGPKPRPGFDHGAGVLDWIGARGPGSRSPMFGTGSVRPWAKHSEPEYRAGSVRGQPKASVTEFVTRFDSFQWSNRGRDNDRVHPRDAPRARRRRFARARAASGGTSCSTAGRCRGAFNLTVAALDVSWAKARDAGEKL